MEPQRSGLGVDRLSLDAPDGGAAEYHEDPELPEEELLRLDDGTPLPAQLAELRSLLQLHSAIAGAKPSAAEAEAAAEDPEAAARLAAIAEKKADMLRECLLDFDEGMLLLHDKLLDHESLCKRLEVERKKKVAVPAGKFAYDEAVCIDDDEEEVQHGASSSSSSTASSKPAAASRPAALVDDEDYFDLSDLLKADKPGGAGARGGGVGKGGGGAAPAAAAASGGGGARSSSSGAGGKTKGGGAEDELEAAASAVAEDDEEALEQKVIASRNQIKAWLRALEEGKAQPSHIMAGVGTGVAAASTALVGGSGAAPPPGGRGGGAAAGASALPPVKPPPSKAKESSFSMRLRMNTSQWSQKTLGHPGAGAVQYGPR